MTPDLEAVATALAKVEDPSLFTPRVDPQALVDALSDGGWHLVADVSLPKSAPRGDRAAEKIEDLSDRQWAVWWALEYSGPSTDEELVERYESFAGPDDVSLCPPQTPQSIRSRRAELVRAGHVKPTGERRRTRNGGTGAVWVARGSGRTEVAA